MARPRYRDPAYRAAVAHWTAVIARRGTICTADICVHGDRTIPARSPRRTWQLGHDETHRDRIKGPQHARCNQAEGARYGNRKRAAVRRAVAALTQPAHTPHLIGDDW